MRIPYDSLTMRAVVDELQPFVGGRLQDVRQPNADDVAFGLYHRGREAFLLISCHAQFARAHLITRRPANPPSPPQFCAALRARVDGAGIMAIRQVGFDRILEIDLEGSEGAYRLVAELMGKHSNMMLIDRDRRLIAAAKWVGASKSTRPIQAGTRYEPPPFEPKASLLNAPPESTDLKQFEGASPFVLKLAERVGLAKIQLAAKQGAWTPVLSPGNGAYPLSVTPLDLNEFARETISIALEQHYGAAILSAEIEQLRGSLLDQLRRVELARETALIDLRQAEDTGNRATQIQLMGELILAYGSTLPASATELTAWDYEGREVTIALDPEMDFRQNANRYFDKAKRAKGRMGLVRDQIHRLSEDLAVLQAIMARIVEETRLDRLRDLQAESKQRRWLNTPTVSAKRKEDRPFEGHRVRELVGPLGYSVLYGENAESNDYLTLRVAKPNDYWLHIRGNTSAHVVIPTRNQPDKVPMEVIQFAAKIAVQNSASKHSGYVPVDYTLKKYVRKPRGGPVGTALYTHEKTLHIDGLR